MSKFEQKFRNIIGEMKVGARPKTDNSWRVVMEIHNFLSKVEEKFKLDKKDLEQIHHDIMNELLGEVLPSLDQEKLAKIFKKLNKTYGYVEEKELPAQRAIRQTHSCPYCKTPIYDDKSKFCENCGKKLYIVCPKCKEENEWTNKFCESCGKRLHTALMIK